jgi:hypothetical protein
MAEGVMPCSPGPCLQAFPMGPFQTAAAAGEHRLDDGFRCDRQGQFRCRRQDFQALFPVILRFPIRTDILDRRFGENVVAEPEGQGRQGQTGVLVEFAEFNQQDLEAAGIGDQEIDADVQANPMVVEARHANLEQRPMLHVVHLMRHPFSRRRESVLSVLIR